MPFQVHHNPTCSFPGTGKEVWQCGPTDFVSCHFSLPWEAGRAHVLKGLSIFALHFSYLEVKLRSD